MQSSVGTHCKNAMLVGGKKFCRALSYCTHRLNPPHPQTHPAVPPDSTHHIPRLNPLHPWINPLQPQTQTAASADSKHSTPRLKPQHTWTQTTAPPDSNHSTPRLKPQHPQTQHLCTRAVKPLLQPLKHFQISPATVLAINSWHTE